MSNLFVTAFFDIGRSGWQGFERSADQYFEWFEPIAALDNEMVIFTTEDNVSRLLRMRKHAPTKVIVVDLMEEYGDRYKRIVDMHNSPEYRAKIKPHLAHHPEYINSLYTLVVNLKLEFMYRASSIFNTDTVTWIDFGYGRINVSVDSNYWSTMLDPSTLNLFSFMDIPPVEQIDVEDVVFNNITYIAGPLLTTGPGMCKTFYKLTVDKIDQMIDMKMLDDDQSVLAALYKDTPELIRIHKIQDWFTAIWEYGNGCNITHNTNMKRLDDISKLYRVILDREPDDSGLMHYHNSGLSIDEIEHVLYTSAEYTDSKLPHTFPTLSYLTKRNGGKWPISWVAAMGLPSIISGLGNNLVGCEIGTNQGWSLVHLISNTDNIDKVIAVDPFLPYDDTITGGVYVTQEIQDKIKKTWHENTRQYSDRIELVSETATVAAASIEDGSLDFVFIDGDHSYDAVKSDLNSYYSKVKSGGLFSGHDYNGSNGTVPRAVHEFLEQHDLPITTLQFCDTEVWYWIKP